MSGRRARFVLTDRDGVRADPALPVRDDAGAVPAGVSRRPYDRLDVALHVGDDPAHVQENRAALAVATGAGPAELRAMQQVHGSTVALVGRDGAPEPVADALVTTEVGPRLVVQVADCVPVALADAAAGVVGVVHAGRRGVQLDVVGRAVQAMTDAGGGRVGDLHAVVGPAVCPSCYEVPAQMHDEVAAVAPAAAARSRTGTPALDLRAAVVARLEKAGVASVEVVGGCTVEDPTLYSYRRDGSRTGRFALVAWLETA